MAEQESAAAYRQGQLRSVIRHARIPEGRAADFWRRIDHVIDDFDRLSRSGDTTFGFVVGLYPIPGYPALPERVTEE